MAKADRKKRDFSRHLQVDTLSIDQLCTGRYFQVDGVKTEKACEVKKIPVMPYGLVRRLVLEECKDCFSLCTISANCLSKLLHE